MNVFRADQVVSTDKLELYPLSVTNTGDVAMLVPLVVISSCMIDVTYFPYDYQVTFSIIQILCDIIDQGILHTIYTKYTIVM